MNMTKSECLDRLYALVLEYGQHGIHVGAQITDTVGKFSEHDRQELQDKCDVCHEQIEQLIDVLRKMD